MAQRRSLPRNCSLRDKTKLCELALGWIYGIGIGWSFCNFNHIAYYVKLRGLLWPILPFLWPFTSSWSLWEELSPFSVVLRVVFVGFFSLKQIQRWVVNTELGVRGPGFLFSSSLSSFVLWAKLFSNCFFTGEMGMLTPALPTLGPQWKWTWDFYRLKGIIDFLTWNSSITWHFKQVKYFMEYLR